MRLRVAARALRFQTDLEVQVIQRITRRRAEEETLAAFQALDGVEGARVRWLDTPEDPRPWSRPSRAWLPRWPPWRVLKARLGVPVSYCFDSGPSLMQGRIAGAFPPRHPDGDPSRPRHDLRGPVQPAPAALRAGSGLDGHDGGALRAGDPPGGSLPARPGPALRERGGQGYRAPTTGRWLSRAWPWPSRRRGAGLDADAASGRRTDRRALEVMSIDRCGPRISTTPSPFTPSLGRGLQDWACTSLTLPPRAPGQRHKPGGAAAVHDLPGPGRSRSFPRCWPTRSAACTGGRTPLL